MINRIAAPINRNAFSNKKKKIENATNDPIVIASPSTQENRQSLSVFADLANHEVICLGTEKQKSIVIPDESDSMMNVDSEVVPNRFDEETQWDEENLRQPDNYATDELNMDINSQAWEDPFEEEHRLVVEEPKRPKIRCIDCYDVRTFQLNSI